MDKVEKAVIDLDGILPRYTGEACGYLLDDDGILKKADPNGMGYFTICTDDEFMETRKRLENKPSWYDAPEWAKWLAQDGGKWDGRWFWSEVEPKPDMLREWNVSDSGRFAWTHSRGHVFGSWRQSLERRPEEKSDVETAMDIALDLAIADHEPQWVPGELPPVGIECEYETTFFRIKNPDIGRCKIIAYYDNKVWVDIVGRDEFVINLNSIKFRPIQSHRDKVIEAADNLIEGKTKSSASRHHMGILYDAGFLKLPEGE